MFSRILRPSEGTFFLFGPRGTGKSTWARTTLPDAAYVDLLDARVALELVAAPHRLASYLSPRGGWAVLDEIQRVPALLDEVQRLLVSGRHQFVLTGSSARTLRRQGVNLLAGRALTKTMHPLTAGELGERFVVDEALAHGLLPAVIDHPEPQQFLSAYVQTYLREEVQQEGLTRNLAAFARFLEVASLSAAMPLNVSAVARDCAVERKVVEDYFVILEDLLIAQRLPVFSRRAKRALLKQSKFFFFDAGVFRAIRPRGPLDTPEQIDGAALETLVLQQVRAVNAAFGLGYTLHYWRTATHREVDLVLYGERGLVAIEIKRSDRIRPEDLAGLRAFGNDYPMAHLWLLYQGPLERAETPAIRAMPLDTALRRLPELLANPDGDRP